MDKILSCFIKLKTASCDMETNWVCSTFELNKDSSSKIFWLDCDNEEVKDFIGRLHQRYDDHTKNYCFGDYRFNLQTEKFILRNCQLSFDFTPSMDGIYIYCDEKEIF